MARAAQVVEGGRLLSLLGARPEVGLLGFLGHSWMAGEVLVDALLNYLDILLDQFPNLVLGGNGRVVRGHRSAIEHAAV